MEILVWLGRRIRANQRIPNPCRQKYIQPQCITLRKYYLQIRRVISFQHLHLKLIYFSGYPIGENSGRILNQKSADEVMFAKRNIVLPKLTLKWALN